jgi:hypothetical protein
VGRTNRGATAQRDVREAVLQGTRADGPSRKRLQQNGPVLASGEWLRIGPEPIRDLNRSTAPVHRRHAAMEIQLLGSG